MRNVLPLILVLALVSCSGDDDVTSDMDITADMGPDTSNNLDDMSVDMGADDGIEDPTVSYEIIYDDDVADQVFAALGPESYLTGLVLAQRFEPPADGKLTSTRIVIGAAGRATAPFELMVYENDNGDPGAELLDEPMLLQADQAPQFMVEFLVTWVDVFFDDLPVSADGFFIGVRFLGTSDVDDITLATDKHSIEHLDKTRILVPGGDWQPLAYPENETPAIPMIRVRVDIPESAAPPVETLLSNTPRDCRGYLAGVLPNAFINQWAAARLIPEATPFEVTRIRYTLRTGPNGVGFPDCDAKIPHRVWVFKGGETPDMTPLPEAEFNVALTESDILSQMTPIDLDLPSPITIEDGEALYIAVEMAGDDPRPCIGGCRDDYRLSDNWLSGGLDTPFAWTNFDVLGDDVIAAGFRAYGAVTADE